MVEPVNDFSWTQDFVISTEQAEAFADPDWAYGNLVVRGHLHVYPAEPNGGKTTVFTYLVAPRLVAAGYEVFYVNADVSSGDAKQMVKFAHENGFKLMLPDISGSSMNAVVGKLMAINNAKLDCSNKVFIFDTLKKMTDVIQKRKSAELYSTLRQLSAKGMTICLLAHTNKHKDKDGNPIFEGTGDLRADVDNLIYLIPHKDKEASTITVSTRPDKIRAAFEAITFEIDRNRNVTQVDEYVDTVAESAKAKKRQRDDHCIQVIYEAIDSGLKIQKDIINFCKNDHGLPVRTIRRVLDTYGMKVATGNAKRLPSRSDTVIWSITKGDKNTSIYELLPDYALDFAKRLGKTGNG